MLTSSTAELSSLEGRAVAVAVAEEGAAAEAAADLRGEVAAWWEAACAPPRLGGVGGGSAVAGGMRCSVAPPSPTSALELRQTDARNCCSFSLLSAIARAYRASSSPPDSLPPPPNFGEGRCGDACGAAAWYSAAALRACVARSSAVRGGICCSQAGQTGRRTEIKPNNASSKRTTTIWATLELALRGGLNDDEERKNRADQTRTTPEDRIAEHTTTRHQTPPSPD